MRVLQVLFQAESETESSCQINGHIDSIIDILLSSVCGRVEGGSRVSMMGGMACGLMISWGSAVQ